MEYNTKKELLQAIRAQLLKDGFDASEMSDTEMEEWCKRADIEILAPSILN